MWWLLGGRDWKLMLRQTGMPLATSAEWRRHRPELCGGSTATGDCSILDELEDCRVAGTFTLKQTWPDNPNLPTPVRGPTWLLERCPLLVLT